MPAEATTPASDTASAFDDVAGERDGLATCIAVLVRVLLRMCVNDPQGRGLQRQLRQVESIQTELSELLDAAAVRLNLEPGSLHE